jgi:hypothetical protein
MDNAEYWLLDSVVEQRHSLSLLMMEGVEAIFDRPPHGLDRGEMIGKLTQLFGQGLLIASDSERGDFVPEAHKVATILDGDGDEEYALTALGGAVWEEASKPDWNRFVDGVFGGSDEGDEFEGTTRERIGEFKCADKAYLEKFMQSLHYRGILPHAASMKWDVEAPWQALYWKALPAAHRVRFLGVGAPQCPEDKIPEEYRDMGVWYLRRD